MGSTGPLEITPPTFVAAGTAATGTTSLSIPYYAGLAADDIAYIFVGDESDGRHGDIADFTGEADEPAINSGNAIRVYWSRLTGGESGSVSVAITNTPTNSVGVMFGIRGAITTGTPHEGYSALDGAGTSASSNTIVTTGPNRLCLRLGLDSGTVATTPPSGWTEAFEYVGANDSITIDTKTRAAAGTEAASARTHANLYWYTATLAVKPA
jgi:hypothetical protein